MSFYSKAKFLLAGLIRKLWRIQGVSWTLQTREEYDLAVEEGWIPIFEYFTP